MPESPRPRKRAPARTRPIPAIAAPGAPSALGALGGPAPSAETEETPWSHETASDHASPDLTPIVAANLRRLRCGRGLSLERLARISHVSRAMLGQIELSQSSPTINVLWKIALALDVPFSALIGQRKRSANEVLPADKAKILSSYAGTFRSRALFPFDAPRKTEFYELRLAPRAREEAEPHPPGTTENLVVARGALEVDVGPDRLALREGDAAIFEADRAHVYRNPGDVESLVYLVVTYCDARDG